MISSKNILTRLIFIGLGGVILLTFIPVSLALLGYKTDVVSTEFSYDIIPIIKNKVWSQTDLACDTGYMQHKYELLSINDANHKYYSTIHATAIILDTDYDATYMPKAGTPSTNDFLTNIKTETMTCSLGDDVYHPCGFDKDKDLGKIIAQGSAWNGTTITYERANFLPGNPRALIWRYSANDFGNTDETPWLYGRDSSSAKPPKLVETIWMEPIDYTIARTATAESYFLVEHWYKDSKGAYHHIFTVDADADQDGKTNDESFDIDPDKDYAYWFGLSGTRLTFDACVIPPPPETLACKNLQITSPSTITAEDAAGIITLTIAPKDQHGDNWNGTYDYAGYNSSGQLSSTCRFSSSYRTISNKGGTNPLQSSSETVYVAGCTPSDTIKVQDINYPSVCADSLQIENACKNLSIISPTEITVDDLNGIVTLELAVNAASGTAWDGQYTFTAESAGSTSLSQGKFTSSYTWALLNQGSNPYTTNSEIVYYIDGEPGDRIMVNDNQYPTVCIDSITAETVTPPAPFCGDGIIQPNGTDNIPNTADDELCDDGALNGTNQSSCSLICQPVEIPPTPACLSLTISPETTTSSTQVVFTISPNPSNWPGPWTWGSSNPQGKFTAENGILIGNPITTTDISVEYNGAINDVITVHEATNYAEICKAQAQIIPPGAGDDDDVNPPTPPGGGTSGGGTTGGGGASTYCGDGIIQQPNTLGTYEECDDGNSVNNDGCSNVCQTELVCSKLEILEPTIDPITYLPVTLKVKAYDSNGNPWVNPDGSGTYHWTTTGQGVFDDGWKYHELDTDQTTVIYSDNSGQQTTTLTVQAGGANSVPACTKQVHIYLPKAPGDTLEKTVDTYNFGFYRIGSSVTTANGFEDNYGHNYDYAFYELRYTPDPQTISSIVLTDDIAKGIKGIPAENPSSTTGSINFYTAKASDKEPMRCWVDNANANGVCGYGGSYRDFSIKYTDGTEIPACSLNPNEPSTETCYTGHINELTGLTFQNLNAAAPSKQIIIHYLGRIDNGTFDCTTQTGSCPILAFTNIAKIDNGRLMDSADVSVICPYLLTRNAGDVYFENDPTAGFDLSCYYPNNYNSDGLVFSKLVTTTKNQVCKVGENNNNQLIKRFSSYICEMLTDVQTISQKWNIHSIQSSQNKNLIAISRYNEDNLSSLASTNKAWGDYVKITNFSDLQDSTLITKTNKSQNVYTLKNKNLVFALTQGIPSGAHTFIVENGTIFIEKDVVYQDSQSLENISNPNDIPSIAFIVLGGDVYVDSNVKKMVGVYYVQKNDQGQGGSLTGRLTDPFTPLEILGSVYGDITPLAQKRTFSGPAQYDHGNIVIRYDERILLNPPPGLEKYVDIESERVAR
ncbi:MAG: hypothetical protein UT36_C0013G0017 [Candidatus Peregrinibacteria bacterium GW2011_GWF2_39_17]|nr:MAG: hypothetical protein UT36_C0013G0017 [Candidatus Peregrinibacteria bacterium GW2011_GWF2_39_17]